MHGSEAAQGPRPFKRWLNLHGRRYLLCLTGIFLLLTPNATDGLPVPAMERLGLEVRESGGLARRGYPVHALLKLPHDVPATTKFRLLHDGKPIVAQFRPNRECPTAQWWLDFQTEIGPHEARKYNVEFGDDVPAGPERQNGHKLTETRDAFVIANSPYITWTIPRDLKGLLRSVHFAPSDFLRADSPGLLLRDRDGVEHVVSGKGRSIRDGAMAVALRFEQTEPAPGLRNVRSSADMTFPAPVSWVEVDWSVDDPLNNVAALGLQLHLNLNKPAAAAPTLVDFGATSVVYTSLYQGQEAEMSAEPWGTKAAASDDPAWKILRGERGLMLPFAVGAKRPVASRIEGWAHVMDRKNCLALAVEDFAKTAHDRISINSDGDVTLWREYDPTQKVERKSLRLWLHLVFFPPQYSAGASPQQMQSPLAVRVVEPRARCMSTH